jgi:hypothetical protein
MKSKNYFPILKRSKYFGKTDITNGREIRIVPIMIQSNSSDEKDFQLTCRKIQAKHGKKFRLFTHLIAGDWIDVPEKGCQNKQLGSLQKFWNLRCDMDEIRIREGTEENILILFKENSKRTTDQTHYRMNIRKIKLCI